MSPLSASPPVTGSRPTDPGLWVLLCISPIVMAVNPPTIGVAISLYAIIWLTLQRAEINLHRLIFTPMALILMAVASYGALSGLWAIDPDLAFSRAWKFLIVMVPIAMLARLGRDRAGPDAAGFAGAVLIGVALAAVLIVWQVYGDFLLRANGRVLGKGVAAIKLNVSVAALAILIWSLPVCLRLTGRALTWRLVAAGAVIATLIAVYVGDGLAPRLALMVGTAVWIISYLKPRPAVMLIGITVIALHGALLTIVPSLYRDHNATGHIADRSILHRIDVWDTVGRMIRERPFLGYGFDNSRKIPALREISTVTGERRAIPLYPHNVLLQAQLELGVLGVIGFYGCLFYLLRECCLLDRVAAASALAMLAAALSIWCVGYPLWRSTWIAWLGFCAISLGTIAQTRPLKTA